MILDELKNWKGAVEIDNTKYDSILSVTPGSIQNCNSIILHSVNENAIESNVEHSISIGKEYRITVKQYMTKPSTIDFDFMQQWNNDVPMPLRTMVGTIEKETKGMVYMRLHGDITSKITQRCMKCGKEITNPISQFFGMGPECGGHNYVSPFENEEELEMVVENYRKNYLQKITWEGWIIKSAITEREEIK